MDKAANGMDDRKMADRKIKAVVDPIFLSLLAMLALTRRTPIHRRQGYGGQVQIRLRIASGSAEDSTDKATRLA